MVYTGAREAYGKKESTLYAPTRSVYARRERGKKGGEGKSEKTTETTCLSCVVGTKGFVGGAVAKSPLDTEERGKNNVEWEEKPEAKKILNENAEDSNAPTDDLVQVGVLKVLDVEDAALIEEGNKSTAEDETASDSAVKKRLVELDGPGNDNTNRAANVLLNKVIPGEVLLRKHRLENRIKNEINGLLHEITERGTEGDSLGKLVLDDHDSSKETRVETAESLVDFVGVDGTHDEAALVKEEFTAGELIDIHDTIIIIIDSIVLLVLLSELLEGLIKINETCTNLLESTALLEGLNDGHKSSKVSTAESDGKTVDHHDRVLGHLVIHSLALIISKDQVGEDENEALVNIISNRSKLLHNILHALGHMLRCSLNKLGNARFSCFTSSSGRSSGSFFRLLFSLSFRLLFRFSRSSFGLSLRLSLRLPLS